MTSATYVVQGVDHLLEEAGVHLVMIDDPAEADRWGLEVYASNYVYYPIVGREEVGYKEILNLKC